MATNLNLNDDLINEALRLGHHKSAKSAVRAALEEYILRRKQLGILDLFGTIPFDETYDYKRERKRNRR